MKRSPRRSASAVTLGLAAALAVPAVAATPVVTGISYGSVTKFSMSSGDAPAAPGSYRSDFDAAASPPADTNVPKLPFGLGKSLGKMNGALSMFKNGAAEKHFIGVNKERTDNLATKTATITDCTARTYTNLDLDKKTYTVTSMDQPQTPAQPGRQHGEPGPEATDDGTKVSLVMTTKALGPMTIEGIATNGYDTNITMTATKPSGESSTTNMNMVAYYAAMNEPHFGCAVRNEVVAGGAGGASMQSFALLMKAMSAKGDSRFTVSNSGPAVPSGKLAMWQSMKTTGSDRRGGAGGSFGIVIERGDVHAPLPDSDPVFGVPADFTKVAAG